MVLLCFIHVDSSKSFLPIASAVSGEELGLVRPTAAPKLSRFECRRARPVSSMGSEQEYLALLQ